MLLVDAYNVLHTKGVLPPEWAGLEIEGLLRLIACSRYATRQVRLVCDGEPQHDPQLERTADGTARRRLGWAEVWYAGSHQQADDLLEHQMRESSAARRWLVVSSDRRIVRAARRVEASVLSSEQFLTQLAADELRPGLPRLPAFATDIPLDRYSVEHWMRTFGFDPAAHSDPSTDPAASGATPAASASRDRKSPSSSVPSIGEQLGSLLSRAGSAGMPSRPVPPPPPPKRSSTNRSAASQRTDPAVGGIHAHDTPSHGAVPFGSTQAPAGAGEPPALSHDPLIQEALRAWEGRLTLEELDMTRWLADTLPNSSPSPPIDRSLPASRGQHKSSPASRKRGDRR